MAKQETPIFATLVTAASPAQIESEAFITCVRHWQQVFRRIVVVVPKKAPTPDHKSVRYFRVDGNVPTLVEVLQHAASTQEAGNANSVVVVCDPVVMTGKAMVKLIEVAIRRNLGSSWMATALAILQDKDGEGTYEMQGLRWFASLGHVWSHTAKIASESENPIPFVSPVWGGWVANWARGMIQEARYHDVTSLNAVAALPEPPPDEVPDSTGYGPLTFNPPDRSYVDPK